MSGKNRDLTFTPSDQPSQPKRPRIEPTEANAASVATNRPRNLQLRFLTELALPPKKKLEGKEGDPILVALIDADTGRVVESGLESSLTLDVVVLEGDFNTEDNWDREEFERYEVKEREGSGPLLTGVLQVKLKDGVGQLGEVTFNDHSNCNRNRRFRIGLKVASGCCENTRIREAKTDAFLVNECRGEVSLKLYPRASDDLIRSLEKKIEKSPQNLNIERNFISDHGTSKKSGNYAKTSELRCYLYCPDGTSKHGVAFDKSGMLIGLLTDGIWFLVDQLSDEDEKCAMAMVRKALANPEDIRRSWGEKETAEKMMGSDMRANAASVATNRPRNLQLRFLTELALPPKKKLEGKEGDPILVALIDADTGRVVESGLESTITVDVVVLEGDFNTEDNWDREEFERYEVKEREGSGPLLTGVLQVKLKDGVGQLGEVTFNDHSNCNRNRRFRIGLKVASGCCENTRIQEAKTDAFLVNECRGEVSLKLYPRASDDLIRSLEKKIEKSPQNLNIERNFISDHGTSKKSGNYAKTSELRCYLYCPDGTSKHGVTFDKSGMLIGLLTDGIWFLADQLSDEDEKCAMAMVRKALANPEDIRRSWGEKETAEKMMGSDMSNTSDGRQFDLLFTTKADIQRVVREEPEPDYIKQILDLVILVREELVKFQSHDLVKSEILNAFKGEVVPEICSSLEDTIRRVVREELKHASSQPAQLERSSGKCQEKDEVRNLRLEFINNLPCSVYTGDKLKVLHSLSFDIKLVNANTGSIVKSGPESSVKLNVVALEGGFKTDDDKWTCKTFDQSVLKERDGKRPLLIGELILTLKEGTGVLGDVEFTDSSSWTRSGQFRIGFQVSSAYSENIREAVTNPFTVKWKRGKASEKHFPPFPNDALWRLKNIGRNGAFCKKLNDARIYTVKDFVQQLNKESEELRKILGEGMTDNMWDDLVDHAKSCPLNGERHVGHNNESDHDVISDNVGQRIGLTSDGVHFAADKFSLKQKEHGDTIRGASSSFPSHSEGETENLTPVLAPRTRAAPVGWEAPSANAVSTAKGDNNIVIDSSRQMDSTVNEHILPFGQTYASISDDQPTYADKWNRLIPPGDNVITGGLLPEPYDDHSQFAMPSHAINSSRHMDSTANEDFLLSRPSLASTSYGQNHVTALPSTAQTPHTYFRNPFEFSANELGHLASHQPISKNNWDDLISPGDNVITIGGSSRQSNDISSQDALCNQMFGPWRKNDAAVNQLALPSEPPSAPPPEGEYVTEDLASDDVDYVLRYLAEPDVDTNFQTMPWKDGSV